LEQLLASYGPVLAAVRERLVKELGPPVTPRLKTTGTLIDKLRRNRNMALSRMQDIAGVRVVREMNRAEQDQLVARILKLFPGAEVMDRRAVPSYGYRAVHVIVEVDRRWVEIQVRTFLQNLWANVFERLADRWGRGIRYGELPNDPDAEVFDGLTRHQIITELMVHSEVIHRLERVAVRMIESETLYAQLKARYDPSVLAEAADQQSLPKRMEDYERFMERYPAERRQSAQLLMEDYERLKEIYRELDRETREFFQGIEEYVL